MKKKFIILAVTVSAVLGCSFSVLAATREEALKTAQKQVPSDSALIKTKEDWKEYEFSYLSSDKTTWYEVEINKQTGKVTSFESETIDGVYNGSVSGGGNSAAVSSENAEAAAKKVLPETCTLVKIKLDDGVYEVEYISQDKLRFYEVKVDTASGKALSLELDMVNDNGSQTVSLTEEQAKEKVKNRFSGAEIISVYTKADDGLWEYKVTFSTKELNGEIELHAGTGAILGYRLSYVQVQSAQSSGGGQQIQGVLSREQIEKILKQKAPNAALVEFETDDDGAAYEGKMRDGRIEYEFKIDAYTGNILEWEIDD